MYSICLSVWEWNNVDSFILIPSIPFNSLVISTANYSPLFNTILSSNLCNFYILSLNNLANPFTNVSSVIATKCVILDNLLQTTRTTSFFATNGNLVIKSTIGYAHSFSGTLLNFNFSISTSVYFLSSNIYCILLHIISHFLLSLTINIFLSPALLSSIFPHA